MVWFSTSGSNMIGMLINDRYFIEVELGQGGMGIVYKARDTVENRPVALKTMLPAVSSSERNIRFQREFRAIARLNHRNVIKVYQSGQLGENFFFAMEYVDGFGLKEFFNFKNNQPFDFSDSKSVNTLHQVLYQMCQALQYVHANRIVHRDLKPENILISVENDPPILKLLDFGLIHDFDSKEGLTQEGIPLGTVAYMPPEQAMGGKVDYRADLYSLGAILYELFTGQLPFVGKNPFALLMQHTSTKPEIPSEICPTLPILFDDIIMRLLEKRPEDRFQSAASLWNQLEKALDTFQVQPIEGKITETLIFGQKYPIFTPALIGRENDLAQVLDLIDLEFGESSRHLFLGGELGAGKSRLIEELKLKATARSFPIFIGSCSAKGSYPFEPFFDILEQIENRRPQANANFSITNSIFVRISQLRIGIRTTYESQDLPGQYLVTNKDEFLDLFFQAIGGFTRKYPGCLILEDIHWADTSTWELLKKLFIESRNLPISILVTYRPEEIQKCAFYDDLIELQKDFDRRIELRKLTQPEVGQMMSSMLGQDIESQKELVQQVYRQSNGNPFFVQEFVKVLVDKGLLYRDEDRWLLKTLLQSQMAIPNSVHDAVSQRLAILNADEYKLLEFASLLGMNFSFDELQEITEWDHNKLLDTLDGLLKSYLLSEDGHGAAYQFAHAFIQNVVYNQIEETWRIRQHCLIADRIEAQHGGETEIPIYQNKLPLKLTIRLAYHYFEAQEYAKAAYYHLVSSRISKTNFAEPEAKRHLRRAMDCLERTQLADLPRDWAISLLRLDAYLCLFNDDFQNARVKLEYALKQIDAYYPIQDQFDERLQLISSYHYSGLTQEAMAVCQECFALKPHLSQKWELSIPHNLMGYLHLQSGRYREAIPEFQKALEILEQYPSIEKTVTTWINLGTAYEALSEFEAFEEYVERAYNSRHLIRDVDRKAVLIYNFARIKGIHGLLDEAIALLNEIRTVCHEIEFTNIITFCENTLGVAYQEKGLLEQARQILVNNLNSLVNSNKLYISILNRFHLLEIYKTLHQYHDFNEQLFYLDEELENFQNPRFQLRRCFIEAFFCLEYGDFDRAEVLLKKLDDFSIDVRGEFELEMHQTNLKIALLKEDYQAAYQNVLQGLKVIEKRIYKLNYLEFKGYQQLFQVFVNPSAFSAERVESIFTELHELGGWYRYSLLLDAMLSHPFVIQAMGNAPINRIIWNFEEENDMALFDELTWKIKLFKGYFAKEKGVEQLLALHAVSRDIIRLANIIDDPHYRHTYLGRPLIQQVIRLLYKLDQIYPGTINLRKIVFFLKKNDAMPTDL